MTMNVNGGSTAGRDAQPIDYTQLSRQTQGDAHLEREVLELFSSQISTVRDTLSGSGERERVRLAHSLVGASRAIGAFPLANAAAALEEAPRSKDALDQLIARSEELCAFISERLR